MTVSRSRSTKVETMTALRSDKGSNDKTTIDLIEAYWRVHWSTFSPAHRSKTRGRLIIMAASLMEPASSSKSVLHALRHQKESEVCERPPSPEVRAARYLRAHFLPRHDDASNVDDSEPQRRGNSATWIDVHSKPAVQINDEDLTRLRINLGGTDLLDSSHLLVDNRSRPSLGDGHGTT
jgi:hypothetical protein